MSKQFYIYILTNKYHTTLYVGVTSNLNQRITQHKQSLVKGFTKKYKLTKLVYFETAQDRYVAFEREKQIKKYRKEKKIKLIEIQNPDWNELPTI